MEPRATSIESSRLHVTLWTLERMRRFVVFIAADFFLVHRCILSYNRRCFHGNSYRLGIALPARLPTHTFWLRSEMDALYVRLEQQNQHSALSALAQDLTVLTKMMREQMVLPEAASAAERRRGGVRGTARRTRRTQMQLLPHRIADRPTATVFFSSSGFVKANEIQSFQGSVARSKPSEVSSLIPTRAAPWEVPSSNRTMLRSKPSEEPPPTDSRSAFS